MPITRSAPLTAAKAGGRAARAFRVAAAIAVALGPAWPTGVGAQELSLLAGPLGGEHEDTYSWKRAFVRASDATRPGAFPGSTKVISRTITATDRCFRRGHGCWRSTTGSSSPPAWGPYRFFDTVAAEAGDTYSDTHGWGAVLSVRAAHYFADRWIAQLKLNRTQVHGGPGTTGILFGVGYQLDAPDRPGPRESAPARSGNVTGDELTAMFGQSILNSKSSETSSAGAPGVPPRPRSRGRRAALADGRIFRRSADLVRRRGTLRRDHPERRSDR